MTKAAILLFSTLAWGVLTLWLVRAVMIVMR